MKSLKPDRGFTLIEMMVTVTVMAIIVAIAAPSFSGTLARTRLKSQAMRVIDVIEFAKSEATKSGTTRSTDGTWNNTVTISVSGGGSWSVTAQSLDADGNATQRKASFADATGVTLASPDTATMTMNFRRVITGDVDTPIVLQAANGEQIQISVGASGRVTACSVGSSIGGFSTCAS